VGRTKQGRLQMQLRNEWVKSKHLRVETRQREPKNRQREASANLAAKLRKGNCYSIVLYGLSKGWCDMLFKPLLV
jgi:hypothetical protein